MAFYSGGEFTKNSFVYRLINKALRTEDVEQMYTFRYFIQDLYSALVIKHKVFKEYGEPVTVYRGLRLIQSEFDELIKDEKQLISMNGYLSTSDSVTFADITPESNFRDENEVLFDIGATFQLTATPIQNDNGVWYLKMIATDEGRTLVRKYIDDHFEFSTDMSPKIIFGVLLYNMGKYDSSLSYFNKLITNPEGDDVALIHVYMARAFSMRGDTNNEWKHYENAYSILVETEPRRIEDEARVLLHMGIFYFDRSENDRALEYLMRALYLFEQVYGKKNVEIARVFLCIGGCYEEKGDNN
ncbi:unnamed protein product [Rotaria sp. Silwood2]|nr:unnamed protein product [Rotaria sp. Silwood2]CAF4167854.1 unnamed protein product [Rotaria sp. Silwood2]